MSKRKWSIRTVIRIVIRVIVETRILMRKVVDVCILYRSLRSAKGINIVIFSFDLL